MFKHGSHMFNDDTDNVSQRKVTMKKEKPQYVLVLPPDERIRQSTQMDFHEGEFYFRGSQYDAFQASDNFIMICIGLWEVFLRSPKCKDEVMGFSFQWDWLKFEHSKLETSACRFRLLTKKEQKTLGILKCAISHKSSTAPKKHKKS